MVGAGQVGAPSWRPSFLGIPRGPGPRGVGKSGRRSSPFHAMPDLVSGLNPEQLRAVTLPRESALILAGAGSGKTRVLTTRIAWLIQTGQVSPAGILAVTFTNKAAREMLTRLSAMLPINTRGMWVGTFHGTLQPAAARALSRRGPAAALPDPRFGRPAVAHQAPGQGPGPGRGEVPAAPAAELHQQLQGSGPARQRGRGQRRLHAPHGRSSTRTTTRSATARAWSISPSCCCAPSSCCRST